MWIEYSPNYYHFQTKPVPVAYNISLLHAKTINVRLNKFSTLPNEHIARSNQMVDRLWQLGELFRIGISIND